MAPDAEMQMTSLFHGHYVVTPRRERQRAIRKRRKRETETETGFQPDASTERRKGSLGGGTVVPRVSKAKKGLIASIILTRAKHAYCCDGCFLSVGDAGSQRYALG